MLCLVKLRHSWDTRGPPAATWMLVDLLAHAAWWASRLSRSCGVGLEQFDSVTTGVSFKVHG